MQEFTPKPKERGPEEMSNLTRIIKFDERGKFRAEYLKEYVEVRVMYDT
jgi:hypothetical protein